MSEMSTRPRAKMPPQVPWKSKQDYATPRPFLDAVEHRWGQIAWDLAAHEGNHVCKKWLGQGGYTHDSLSTNWGDLPGSYKELLWLNPPFADITPWAQKCAESAWRWPAIRIAFLVPASVGSEWFAAYVHNRARVLALRPRLSFDGKQPYPKDCILTIYNGEPATGFDPWKWNR